ncbi:MAG: DNA recombination protein RmuC [Christensenellaceae bacterium]|jgi:DNA recombination protein RmuC|nr:DNA recombination protein RmuC [Christensenellaceae bacterium]
MEILIIALVSLSLLLSVISLLLLFSVISKLNQRTNRRDSHYEIAELIDRSTNEMRRSLNAFGASTTDTLFKGVNATNNQILTHVKAMSDINAQKTLEIRDALSAGLLETRADLRQALLDVRTDNNKQLERMRETVDQKLSTTLDERLAKSFNFISERLEAVNKSLGEMQALSDGVTELRRTLTNVKSRGTWGEVSLDAILSDILTPEQYERNSNIGEFGDRGRVDFAVVLPGSNDGKVFLPIDVKFPVEDYLRMSDSLTEGDIENYNKNVATFTARVRLEAKRIAEKYIKPPRTTDFAVMYLPTEGLFGEILRRRGLIEELQNNYKVIPAGPANISAMLNALRQGFRNLTISKYSKEIYALLSAFRKEFLVFSDIVSRAQGQLNTASKSLEEAGRKTDTIKRKLERLDSVETVVEETPTPGLLA